MYNVRAKREWATSDCTDETVLNNSVRKDTSKQALPTLRSRVRWKLNVPTSFIPPKEEDSDSDMTSKQALGHHHMRIDENIRNKFRLGIVYS